MGAGVILGSFLAALGQLGDPRFMRVLGLGLLLSLALLFGVYALFLMAMTSLTPDTAEIWLIGPVEGVHSLIGWASLGLMLILSAFLMIPVAAAFAGLFTDDVARAVEARHYAWLPPAPPTGLAAGLKATVNLIGLILVLNLVLVLAIPLTGGMALPVYYIANGFLLGREYFTAAALRRMDEASMRDLRARNFWRIWLAGTLMAMPLSLPLVNLVIPVIGTATFTHLYHRIRAGQG